MTAPTTDAVVCERLSKRFENVTALDRLDLRVPAGMIYGLLGPNGAGKTTLVRTLATLTLPSAGRAEVCGLDVVTQADAVRRRIGLTGQEAAVDERIPRSAQSPPVRPVVRSPRESGTPARRRAA